MKTFNSFIKTIKYQIRLFILLICCSCIEDKGFNISLASYDSDNFTSVFYTDYYIYVYKFNKFFTRIKHKGYKYYEISIDVNNDKVYIYDRFAQNGTLDVYDIQNKEIEFTKIKMNISPHFSKIIVYDGNVFFEGSLYGVAIDKIYENKKKRIETRPEYGDYTLISKPISNSLNLYTASINNDYLELFAIDNEYHLRWSKKINKKDLTVLEDFKLQNSLSISNNSFSKQFTICYEKKILIIDYDGNVVFEDELIDNISNHLYFNDDIYLVVYNEKENKYNFIKMKNHFRDFEIIKSYNCENSNDRVFLYKTETNLVLKTKKSIDLFSFDSLNAFTINSQKLDYSILTDKRKNISIVVSPASPRCAMSETEVSRN